MSQYSPGARLSRDQLEEEVFGGVDDQAHKIRTEITSIKAFIGGPRKFGNQVARLTPPEHADA